MRITHWIGFVLVIGVIVGWSLHAAFAPNGPAGAAEAEDLGIEPQDLAVPVRWAPVELAEFPVTVPAIGRVQASPGAAWLIASRASGRILEVAVAPGARVTRGDLLVRFDPAPLDAAVAEAKAAVTATAAELAAFDDGGGAATGNRLASELERARAEVVAAAREVERLEALEPDGLVSERALTQARLLRDSTVLDQGLAERAVSTYADSGARTDRARLVAAGEGAAARLGDAEAIRSEVDVRAPADGVVALLDATPGRVSDAGAVLGTLLVSDERVVTFQLPPVEASRVRDGARVTWTADDAIAGSGSVISVAAVTDPANGLVEVRVRPLADQTTPHPGASVRGAIEIRRIIGALVVPVAALIRVDGEDVPGVLRIDDEHIAHVVRVEVQARHLDSAAIAPLADELTAGQHVVITGGHHLPDGAHVVEQAEESHR